MCIAILQKENHFVTKKQLYNSWINNPDGAGLLWVENGRLQSFKELKSFRTFYKKYRRVTISVGEHSKIVIHFRIATHGYIDLENCHPFFINPDLAFVHNGIIDVVPLSPETKDRYSDTALFNMMLQRLPNDFLKNQGILDLIAKCIEDSMLVFLNSSNDAWIINEGGGEWVGGVWFSNDTYKSWSKVTHWYDTRFDGDTDTKYNKPKEGGVKACFDSGSCYYKRCYQFDCESYDLRAGDSSEYKYHRTSDGNLHCFTLDCYEKSCYTKGCDLGRDYTEKTQLEGDDKETFKIDEEYYRQLKKKYLKGV